MDLLLDLIATLSRWSRSHLYEISLAIMATLFVLFGPARASRLAETGAEAAADRVGGGCDGASTREGPCFVGGDPEYNLERLGVESAADTGASPG